MKPISERIAALEMREKELSATIARQDVLAGSFPLGVGCMSNRQIKQHDARMERTLTAASALRTTQEKLTRLKRIQKGVEAGECYEDGQPCANRPSKLREQDLNALFMGYVRSVVKPGDNVELICNGSIVRVERLLKKHVVIENRSGFQSDDSDWEALDVRPLKPDGAKMTDRETIEAFRAWRSTQVVTV